MVQYSVCGQYIMKRKAVFLWEIMALHLCSWWLYYWGLYTSSSNTPITSPSPPYPRAHHHPIHGPITTLPKAQSTSPPKAPSPPYHRAPSAPHHPNQGPITSLTKASSLPHHHPTQGPISSPSPPYPRPYQLPITTTQGPITTLPKAPWVLMFT